MNTLDERWRDPKLLSPLLRDISRHAGGRRLVFMHVCGTHENALGRFGLRTVLPESVRLLAGPGCPVCVCPESVVSRAARLSLVPGITVATFGDMVRVPGHPSLAEARARGGAVQVVMGVSEAWEYARAHPGEEVVFLAVGFETTACTVAAALLAGPPPNACVLAAHRLIPPALAALLRMPELQLDGFLLPGHVLAVAGREEYERFAEAAGRPCAIAGFEPADILLGLRALVTSAERSEAGVVNAYARAVRPEGNPRAREAIDRAFRVIDAEWRGLGTIPASGLAVRDEWREHDASIRFEAEIAAGEEAGGAAGARPGGGARPPHPGGGGAGGGGTMGERRWGPAGGRGCGRGAWGRPAARSTAGRGRRRSPAGAAR